jgi:anti-sigma regulatory factor (Ser/Thr protein kinase)
MNDTRSLHLSFAPTFAHVDMVRAAVNGICSDFFQISGHAAILLDFCLIISELMNNAVEHADSGILDAEILLTDREAVFRLISDGKRFDPTRAAAMPDLKENELPEGGYGLALIQSLADGMEYERRNNRNMVTLRKTFPLKAEKGA